MTSSDEHHIINCFEFIQHVSGNAAQMQGDESNIILYRWVIALQQHNDRIVSWWTNQILKASENNVNELEFKGKWKHHLRDQHQAHKDNVEY